MWAIGLYLIMGIMTWVVYDKACKEQGKDPSDAQGMVTLIVAWPWYLYAWFTDSGTDDGA